MSKISSYLIFRQKLNFTLGTRSTDQQNACRIFRLFKLTRMPGFHKKHWYLTAGIERISHGAKDNQHNTTQVVINKIFPVRRHFNLSFFCRKSPKTNPSSSRQKLVEVDWRSKFAVSFRSFTAFQTTRSCKFRLSRLRICQ